MINLSRVVTNPHFTQVVTRIIRKVQIDNYGRNIPTEYKTKISCVITSPKDSDLIRLMEGTQYTKFKIFTSGNIINADSLPGMADIILYKGNHYLIISVDDYSEYGFSRAYGAMLETAVAKQDRGL